MNKVSITLNWSDIDLKLTGEDRKLDIFFQPGLSLAEDGPSKLSTVMIALFFLENDPPKGASGLDFQRLAKAMLRWVKAVAVSDPATAIDTPKYYMALYEAFLETPFNYDQFFSFLKKNFEFRIKEPTGELNGTIFPIFPTLTLDVGKTPNTNPPQFSVTQQGLQDGFGNLTSQFAYDFDFVSADSTNEESAREFIFEDYGQLLLRTALQNLQDFLPPLPEDPDAFGPTKTLEAIITEMDGKKEFDQLASIASRFMLHGLRLPVVNPLSVKPVFEATGQQFKLDLAKDKSAPPQSGTKPDYTIQLSRPPALNGFIDCFAIGSTTASDKLIYNIEEKESTTNTKYPLVAMMEGFKQVSDLSNPLKFDEGDGKVVEAMKFYRFQQRNFAMRKWIGLVNEKADGTREFSSFILQIPSSLRQFLARTAKNPTINLFKIAGGQSGIDLKDEDNRIKNSEYEWAVQIDVRVRQIGRTDAEGFLPGGFELEEISESQINLLESVINNTDLASASIQILSHSSEKKDAGADDATEKVEGLSPLPGSDANFALIRHNFSTNGKIPSSLPAAIAPLPAADADATTKKQFLQMLWEGATIESGGYFFVSTTDQTAHDALFADKSSILLSLLVKYNLEEDKIFDFHNTVVLHKDTSDFLENNLLLAVVETPAEEDETSEENYDVPVLTVPPGFIGFQYLTNEPQNEAVELSLENPTQLRQEPKTSGALITNLSSGNVKVFNLSKDGKWAFAQTSGGSGWLPLSTTTPASGNTPASTTRHLSPPAGLNRDHGLAELKSLYHLLGYAVKDQVLSQNLPIGPAGDPDVEDDDSWTYEKLIPAHAKMGQAKPSDWPDGAPPWEQNPYRGITETSSLTYQYWWQDIYGNKLHGNGVPSGTSSKEFKVRYTDPLIGINQWPSLNEQYQFVKDADGLKLEIELNFSPVAYDELRTGSVTEALTRRLKADLITYQKVYYQLKGDGLDFCFKTSLSNDADWQLELKPEEKKANDNTLSITDFVLKIYEYLAGLKVQIDGGAAAKSYEGTSFKLPLTLTGFTIKNQFIQGISCWMIMKRDKKLVHPDLDDDPKLKNIFENQSVLSPKHEAIHYAIKARQTLDSLVKDINDKKLITNEFSVESLVLQQRSVRKTIRGGVTIKLDDLLIEKAPDPENDSEAETKITFQAKRDQLKKQEEEEINKLKEHPEGLTVEDGSQAGETISTDPETGVITTINTNTKQSIITDPKTGITTTTNLDTGVSVMKDPTTGHTTTTDPATGISVVTDDGTGDEIATYFSGQKLSRTPGLSETVSREVNTEDGDSFEALARRISQEMKEVLGPNYPVEFTLSDFADNFKNKTSFLQQNTQLTISPLNLRKFAENFTNAFPDFHIAVSEERNAGGGQANAEGERPEFLFAVRLGKSGISYDIADQDPNFYAIPPITTTLFSGKAVVFDDPENKGGEEEKEVEGLDPNPLAREFLATLEEILEPEILLQAYELNDTKAIISDILNEKSTLAEKIATTVEHILMEDENADRLALAKDAIHQRLLNNLVEGYDIESIVQYEAKVTNGGGLPASTNAEGTHPPRMVGKAKVLRVRVGEDPLNRVPAERDDLDYTLSSGYFELDQGDGQSSFTYLFDTRTPEKFGNLELEMEFQPLEMEFNLVDFPDPDENFESSNKLRFVLPANLNVYQVDQTLAGRISDQFDKETEFTQHIARTLSGMVGKKFFSLTEFETALSAALPAGKDLKDAPYRKYCDALLSDANPNYMGRKAVPIPLRYYPVSPSLVLHEAEADESSREVIRDLREWRYTIIYEHPEVAQDSIDCIVKLNVKDNAQVAGSAAPPKIDIPPFVRLLLNFQHLQSSMMDAIAPMKKGVSAGSTEATAAKAALEKFSWLTKEITKEWKVLRTVISQHYEPKAGDLHFEVSEETKTFVGSTDEAETREGLVFSRSGLADASLIKLDRSFVEKDGVPSAKELLELGIVKQGRDYFKHPVPILELPGFLQAKLIELDKAEVESKFPAEEEQEKAGIIKKEVILENEDTPEVSYWIKVFPDQPLPTLVTDPTAADNPAIVAATATSDERRTFFYLIDPEDQTFFGDSSIPDRKFSIDNLDLLQQQNAWASIFLSRNKNLVFNKTTNPDFIFRTPAVRFSNRVTPSIVNREPWDVATLPTGGTAANADLVNHLRNMLELFKPGVSTPAEIHKRYELQLACRYAYAMAEGSGLNEDLVTTLPILLGLRLIPDQLDTYPGSLSKEISTWFKTHLPVEENASLIFSMEAFSQLDPEANTSLPLLRVTNLELKLDRINNMADIRKGNG